MSEEKFTGGEWFTDPAEDFILIDTRDEFANNEMPVAVCRGPDREANAQLLVSSKGLLAACEFAIKYHAMKGLPEQLVASLNAAIRNAKATGGKI